MPTFIHQLEAGRRCLREAVAVASGRGNNNLKLKRGFTKHGGGCHITVGDIFEVVGLRQAIVRRSWTAKVRHHPKISG